MINSDINKRRILLVGLSSVILASMMLVLFIVPWRLDSQTSGYDESFITCWCAGGGTATAMRCDYSNSSCSPSQQYFCFEVCGEPPHQQ